MEHYASEEEFLKNYDPDQFEKLSMTSDILLFSVADLEQENYRKLSQKTFSVLLVKRTNYPFKDRWCLPGGFMRMEETLEEAAERVLRDETNLENIYMEQLYTFSTVNRDPRMRIVSTAHMALVDKNRLPKTASNASWFHLSILEDAQEVQLNFDNGIEQFFVVLKKVLVEKTSNRYSYLELKNDSLAFDHAQVIALGRERLKNKIEYTDIVFHMMPDLFTLGELQQVYEVILDKKLLDPAFRRIIAEKVEKTDHVKTGGGHRPSVLFRYKG